VIVAVDASELDRLNALYERGQGNGVPDLKMIGPAELRDLEPHVTGVAALHVGDTAIIDFAAVCRAYADEVVRLGGELLLGSAVRDVADTGRRVTLVSDRGEVSALAAVTCAGLYSDRFGGQDAGPRIVPFRGDYYTLAPAARPLVRSLIYPVPDPALPFLGVHFTRRFDGEVWAGPNAVLAFAREGYGRTTVRPSELAETLLFGGFRRLARRHWRTGVSEMWRDVSRPAFVAQLRRYIPELRGSDLVWGPSGVRAQAVAADGSMVDDFAIVRTARALYVRNAPSPGATASLAIGDHLAAELEAILA
jgi:L-2-hydroxyglutarate oxidase LhgO